LKKKEEKSLPILEDEGPTLRFPPVAAYNEEEILWINSEFLASDYPKEKLIIHLYHVWNFRMSLEATIEVSEVERSIKPGAQRGKNRAINRGHA